MPLFESGSGIQLTNLQYSTVHSSGMRASVSYNTVVYTVKHTIPTEWIDLIILQIIITDFHLINIIFWYINHCTDVRIYIIQEQNHQVSYKTCAHEPRSK